ncbi:MAG: thiamine diphosphokinase, partial [Oscillospiraceae bacterium]|nr:thiamine diphosphokinase [Oscillospiraceae bacterium]
MASSMNGGAVCHIVGAGEFYEYVIMPGADDITIAADGGYAHLTRMGVYPDAVIGDFDSLAEPPAHHRVIKLSREKDDTDMHAAIKMGLQGGYRVFRIYGGTGGRLDHTLANINSLVYLARNGARGFLYGDNIIITAICNENIMFDAGAVGIVSVFAHGGAANGVSICGLKYELDDVVLSDGVPLGVSNELT